MKQGRYSQQWNTLARRRWIISLVLILTCPFLLAETKEQRAKENAIYKRVFPVGVRPNKDALNSLTGDEQQMLIEHLRSAIDAYRKKGEDDASLGGHTSTLQLAMLGDDKARAMVVASFLNERSGEGWDSLKTLNEPKVIPMIGEALFRNEVYVREPGSDVGFVPTQKIVGEVTLHILCNSPKFSAEVINWARRVRSEKSPFDEVQILRDWYRANEAMLKAWDFKAVQPGAEPPERKQPVSAEANPLPSASEASRPGTAPVSSPDSAQIQGSPGNVYAWIAAILLVASGGLIWVFRHSLRNPSRPK